MSIAKIIDLLIVLPNRLLSTLVSPGLLLLRLWVGWEFFKSGWLKITNWDGTLFLFQQEYHVPLLPPDVAAVLGTAGELAFPVVLWLGIASRLGALGLSAVNAMAVIAYADVLLSEGFEAALAQHYLWGLSLVVLAIAGPGNFSVDYWLTRQRRSPTPGRSAVATA
jgi:putative oxidoreductase